MNAKIGGMKTSFALGLVLLLVFAAETRVDAYLDPGSGSMLVQLLLGGVAGAAVIVKLGWQRFRSLFGGSSAKDETKSDE
jgi:hypothetical protein